jgi:hypothetical protein
MNRDAVWNELKPRLREGVSVTFRRWPAGLQWVKQAV